MKNVSVARLAQVDLNLLTVFRALDETRSVTRAAKALGVSQPAASHALRRLREAFDDAMFIRTPRGMVLTPRAEALAPLIRETLTRVEHDILGGAHDFRPEALTRTFRVQATDFVEALLVPKLLETLGSAAPLASVSLVPTQFGRFGPALPREALFTGACDLAIAGFSSDLPEGFYQQRLFVDRFACAVRKGHPRIAGKRKLTLDAYCSVPHVLIAPGGELRGGVDRALERVGRARRVVVGVSGFLIAGFIASQSDAVLTAPSRLIALMAESLSLVTFEPPLAMTQVHVVQAWHARNHEDAAHRWLRESIRELLR
jgi:DNA-binding transcriptional LysR family regulator